ncbi:hypothetical protein BD289DRAFT_363844 [Coniella lustricola]|uniref:DUF7729 domain-containing protein n=1 Tax=Coniella lustricola TaxID=2025994 RepID=A0A2T3AEU4_9PEZI|nr:hypothetical protein BD289DRAFT_363844 [Coniella lustricola]
MPDFAPIAANDNENEALLVDTRTRVKEGGVWTALHAQEHELRKRKTSATTEDETTSVFSISVKTETSTTPASSETSSADSNSETATKSATTATSSTSVAAAAATTTTTTSSTLPTFFDGALSDTNVSATCPGFINNMIAAAEFQACYPVSLLMETSTSFFDAQKSLVTLSTVLDHACAANATGCTTYLANVAANLTKNENCGEDYAAGDSTATEAYLGLISYPVVYSATCLKDDETSAYCYAETVTNTTASTQTYFYFLPLNSTLPGGAKPICEGCLKDTMDIYHVATANRNQPIANTYLSAAADVDQICGPSFANATLAEAMTVTGGALSALNQGSSLCLLVTAFLTTVIQWLA